MICLNYDLCEKCHSGDLHNEHEMLKIQNSADALAIEDVVRVNRLMENVF